MNSGKTIYIVDDDDDDRMLAREALENVIDKVEIIEVLDGQDLIDLLKLRANSSEPFLIMLDINMPRMNGMETLARIRSDPDNEYIPVIMFSTSTDPRHVKNAYKIGVNAYLKKPVSIIDYTHMAESVNVCFLNNYPSSLIELPLKKARTKSILVIEDHPEHWELMRAALRQSMPYAAITRMKDSESTLRFLENEWHQMARQPQLILMDMCIPNREQGLELLAKIRKFLRDNNLSTVPIIIFSNSAHQDDIKACYQRQANAYITKPRDLNDSLSYFKSLNEFIWDTYVE
ncbi:response regulator [Dyadobacter sp. CY356]|uniref:response regulator n=1 Tax=Dyadobacter sp. CY356 TaxID=2906442 RepID=UPI001F30E226|nr:response regulator [Dyadobacter sp. CY356]